MCKYYGYIRVSTGTQVEKGYGLDTQIQEINKFAASHKISIDKIFSDAGITGNMKDDDEDDAITRRVAFMDLLSIIGEGDSIIVQNTSRLWRSDMTKAIVRRELIRHNVSIISVEQPSYDLYSKDPNEYLTNAIMEVLDVYDRMSLSLKLARGRSTKAYKGDKPSGICPYGYKYSDDKKSVIIAAEEAKIVKFIYSEAQKGTSLQKIADKLNNMNIPTRYAGQIRKTKQGTIMTSGSWKPGTIHLILHNRFYIGELEHAGKTIQGNHDPIISKIQFGKVAAALNRRCK